MNLNQIKKMMDRKKSAHKGDSGKALLIGGSEEYVGAITLAGLASLRVGCDSITVAAPEQVAWTINCYTPDLITHKITGKNFNIKHAKDMVKMAEMYDAFCLGNGITKKANKFCEYVIKKSEKLKVVDADALMSTSFKDYRNSILTPHETELEMMLINNGKEFLLPKLREADLKEKAQILQGNLRYFLQNNNVLLVKGHVDIIISKNKIAFNKTGNQGMTKAGTGDVLAGIALGFLAKTGDLYKSAVAAAFLNGWVGDILLKKKKGYVFIASDIVEDMEKINSKIGKIVKDKEKAHEEKEELAEKALKPATKKTVKKVEKSKTAKKSVKKPVKKEVNKKVVKKPAKKTSKKK